ncbi:S-formylglutathione hydrolase [Bartonella sp. HY038]|uniref:S-formylglutathione hydrolase n=1 Tax=Bartonella sp. HY038 TaxID=2759660 RepID=UPI0015FDE698|nr:S-formylglutathione hydrolase [Bartonella sp. HY038]
MEIVSQALSFGGIQGVYRHKSLVNHCDMTFALFMPPQTKNSKVKVPLLWFLSGLTCSHQNVMDKGEYRRLAAELGVAIICPDTSPRGDDVPDEPYNWQFGKGAGFYVDALETPFTKNYNMYSYIVEELPAFVAENFAIDMHHQSIMGHSMGGHGAMMIALKNPLRFKSVSAFAPIVNPSTSDWSIGAFKKYLGEDSAKWRSYDSVCLIEDGARLDNLLIDQGSKDSFLEKGLKPKLLLEACEKANMPLTLNMREGYDHSYFFISTFMDNHLRYHFNFLNS